MKNDHRDEANDNFEAHKDEPTDVKDHLDDEDVGLKLQKEDVAED